MSNYVLESEQLLIRPLQICDQSFYVSLYCDAEVMNYIGEPLDLVKATKAFGLTLQGSDRSINCGKLKLVTWVIICKRSSTRLGIQALNWTSIKKQMDLSRHQPFLETLHKCPEIGIMLSKEARGHGVGRKAIDCLLKYSFEVLFVPMVHIIYHRENLRMEKLTSFLDFSSPTELGLLNANSVHKYITNSTLKC